MEFRCGRQPKVLAHAQAVHHVGDLVLDADAVARDDMCLRAQHALSRDAEFAGGRPELARDHLEERAFSGSVRADQAAQFPLLQGEIHARHGPHPTEALFETLRFKNDGGGHFGPRFGMTRRRR
jgi:hypothetical protein